MLTSRPDAERVDTAKPIAATGLACVEKRRTCERTVKPTACEAAGDGGG